MYIQTGFEFKTIIKYLIANNSWHSYVYPIQEI